MRGLLIRRLFQDPPPEGSPSLRDTLRLNRIVDRGVTHASVGHTDAMFFQLFEAKEGEVAKTPHEVADEAAAQLALIEEELTQIVGVMPVEATRKALEH